MAAQGRNVEMTITTDDTYIPGTDSWDAYVSDLEFRLQGASDLSKLKTDFEVIKRRLEEVAKSFVAQNGTIKSGRLYNNIRAEYAEEGRDKTAITLGVPGVHYAGHIEWGFTGRDGMPKGPWPFLRPAIHLVGADSTGRLMEAIIEEILGETGTVSFGRRGGLVDSSATRYEMANMMAERRGATKHNDRAWTNNTANGIRGMNWSNGKYFFNYWGEL